MNLSQPVTLPDGSVLQVPVPQRQQTDNFPLTEDEALSAARYGATVQYQSLYGQQQNLSVTKEPEVGRGRADHYGRGPDEGRCSQADACGGNVVPPGCITVWRPDQYVETVLLSARHVD